MIAAIWGTVTACILAGGENEGAADRASSAWAHPLGRIDPQGEKARVAIRELDVLVEHPIVPGERLVLSTVGTERMLDGERVFRPLLSILVDRTFPDAPGGEWLAIWSLGQKRPGFLSRLRAAIPGFTAGKKASPEELERLEGLLGEFAEHWNTRDIPIPQPDLTTLDTHRDSDRSLILNGIKTALGFTNLDLLPKLLYRGYLLRRDDARNRHFQQSYLGLIWYGDLSRATPRPEALSPSDLNEIKFHLLANRSMLGRWVLPEAGEAFVHHFESQMRDHLWGTSCRLASDANEHHLGYEELQRFSPDGVPMALGGVLYYDPAIAPEPEQARWSIANPFDLTYNPFSEPAVLEAAKSGDKVPLALYVYQSNLALKPIIVVDFFRPGNPRLRESATYWRKVGNEALASSSLGFIWKTLNSGLGFAANRKGLTWFSDKKLALGIEELRLSLMNQMYFEPEAADRLLSRVDRLTINPLVQSGLEKRLRAQLDYRALMAEDGLVPLLVGRRLRNKRIRELFDIPPRALGARDYDRYRRHLRHEFHLDRLRVFLREPYAASIPLEDVHESLQALGREANVEDKNVVQALEEFRLETARMRGMRREGDLRMARLAASALDTLGRIYGNSGLGEGELRADLAEIDRRLAEKAAKQQAEQLEQQAGFFEKEMKKYMGKLEALARKNDLAHVSPWHLSRALDFFDQVPEVIASNPKAAEKFRKREERMERLLNLAERRLADAAIPADADWLESRRQALLASLRGTRAQLRAALDWERPADAAGVRTAPTRTSSEPDIRP